MGPITFCIVEAQTGPGKFKKIRLNTSLQNQHMKSVQYSLCGNNKVKNNWVLQCTRRLVYTPFDSSISDRFQDTEGFVVGCWLV